MKKLRKYQRPKPNKFEDQDVHVVSRWLALIRSVNVIFDKADKLGVHEDRVDLSPNDIQDYIDDISGDIYFEIMGSGNANKIRPYASRLTA